MARIEIISENGETSIKASGESTDLAFESICIIKILKEMLEDKEGDWAGRQLMNAVIKLALMSTDEAVTYVRNRNN